MISIGFWKPTRKPLIFGEIAETTMSMNDCFNAADAMIADVSSAVTDFLYSEKPLALFPSPRQLKNSSRRYL